MLKVLFFKGTGQVGGLKCPQLSWPQEKVHMCGSGLGNLDDQ